VTYIPPLKGRKTHRTEQARPAKPCQACKTGHHERCQSIYCACKPCREVQA